MLNLVSTSKYWQICKYSVGVNNSIPRCVHSIVLISYFCKLPFQLVQSKLLYKMYSVNFLDYKTSYALHILSANATTKTLILIHYKITH